MGNALVLIAKDNPWRSLFESLDRFSEDFMITRHHHNRINRIKGSTSRSICPQVGVIALVFYIFLRNSL
jgi:hypothetical protein